MEALAGIQELVVQANRLEATQRERLNQYTTLYKKAVELQAEITEIERKLELYVCACNLLGEVSDSTTQETLNSISGVINKALGVLFPNDSRTVRISKTMYREVHPHFNVDLITENGAIRSFKQSGSGLAQIISYLFSICLIDARGGRKLIIQDELLNGLHPRAKKVVKALMLAVSDHFQIVSVEYGLDVGKEYVIEKSNGTAEITPYDSNCYYQEVGLEDDTEEE